VAKVAKFIVDLVLCEEEKEKKFIFLVVLFVVKLSCNVSLILLEHRTPCKYREFYGRETFCNVLFIPHRRASASNIFALLHRPSELRYPPQPVGPPIDNFYTGHPTLLVGIAHALADNIQSRFYRSG
jgi:hypothetical protein